MVDSLEAFNREIMAVAELVKQHRRLCMTPPVDDDFPQVKYEYDRAVRVAIAAFREYGRNVGVDWISVDDRRPDEKEPVVYRRPDPYRPGRWHVGIAYWTVSGKWNPELESVGSPHGFTHWMPLP